MLNILLKKVTLKTFEKAVISISIAFSLLVMIGWFIKIYEVLGIPPVDATMKFNTALVFFISGIIMILQHKKWKNLLTLTKVLAGSLILIGGLTLVEHLGWVAYSIDNIIVTDIYSTNSPGRMSPATAICSILVGIGFLGNLTPKYFFGKIGLYAFKLTALLSLVAIIAFILSIPLSSKASLIQTMAINTSGLFLIISILQLFKSPNSLIYKIVTGNFEGSKLTRKILPTIVLFPIIFSYLLIIGIDKNIITTEFGMVAYAAIFIPISIIYVAYIAIGLNKTDAEKQQLAEELNEINRYYLRRFKEGVNQVSIVSLLDPNRVITYVNDSFRKISQYSKKELIGSSHSILNSGHHSKEFFDDMWETISSGEIWVNEIKNKAKDGSFYWTLTAFIPFKNDKEQITEYMVLSQDITERKEAEALRMSYVKKLEYKNKELEQFAYVASHDLQEPLRTVMSFTDLLAKKRSDSFDELGLRSIKYIQEATLRMSQLIKSLLDYNQIDKGNELSLVDCNELIKGIVNDLGKNIQETNTSIKVDKLPLINGYKTPLRMVFQNLINNAIKFRNKDTKPQITITASQNEYEWLFSVKDNGIGISDEHQEKIFEIFQRLHNKNKYKGSGIGLAHCRKIVDLHGGKIWVESKLNEGSTFNFTIRTKDHEKKSKLYTAD